MNQSTLKILVIDATGAEKGKRIFTRDAIGAGPRSVCGVLEKAGLEAKIILAEEILTKGFPKGFNSLFISAMSMDKVAVNRIIQKWKEISNGIVVLGGPITAEFNSILENSNADIIVIGEGEKTIEEILKSDFLSRIKSFELLKKINGISYRDQNNRIKINEFRFYSTTDEFKKFRASTKRIKDYPNYFSAKVYVECVRGCSNFGGTKLKLIDGRQCSFCGNCDSDSLEDRLKCPEGIPPGCGFCCVPNVFGPARSRNKEDIIEEISELLDLGVKRIILSAPDFLDFGRDKIIAPKPLIHPTSPKVNLPEIERLLLGITNLNQIKNKHARAEIENIKAQLFTEEVAQIVSRYLPKTSFSIGCETGSAEHAKLLGRSSSPQDTLKAVKTAKKYELKTHVYFIHGLPGQTKESAQETANLIFEMEPYIDKVTIYRFRSLPMSAFGDFPEPKAAINDPVSKIISDAANQVNLNKKKNLIGKRVSVIVSEENFREKGGYIANILEGGPKVSLKDSTIEIGDIIEVIIESALSDKLVQGRVIRD